MVKILIRRNNVEVIGMIWMPPITAVYVYHPGYSEICPSVADLVTRESVRDWLDKNGGDFQSIDDFRASIEVGEETIEIPWEKEESEYTFLDCMEGGVEE